MRRGRWKVALGPALGLLVLTACGGPSGQRLSATEYEQMERSRAAQATLVSRDQQFQQGRDALEERQAALDRRTDELRARTVALDLRREVVRLVHERATLEDALALGRAERALAWAREDLEHLVGLIRPRRLAEARLEQEAAAAEQAELAEELAQLEQLYGDETLAEETADLVLMRARRRLELAQRRLELAALRLQELEEVLLPREAELRAAAVVRCEVELTMVQHGNAAARLEREAELAGLELERETLVREQVLLERQELTLDDDRLRFERDAATRAAGS